MALINGNLDYYDYFKYNFKLKLKEFLKDCSTIVQ